jgi:DNA-binding NarL/FixJ family response regulator
MWVATLHSCDSFIVHSLRLTGLAGVHGKQIMTNFDQANVTPRDNHVLNLLVQGCSNKEIGEQLNISLCTVNITLARCFCVPKSSLDVNR